MMAAPIRGRTGMAIFLLNVCSTLTVRLRNVTLSVIFKRSSNVHLEFFAFLQESTVYRRLPWQ